MNEAAQHPPSQRPRNLRPAFGLKRKQPARAAVQGMVVTMLNMARAAESGIAEDLDIEYLHDYRVCLRKIRSLLSQLKGVYPAQETERLLTRFAELSRRTNRLRDHDVFLAAHDRYLALLPPSLAPFMEEMFDDFRKERALEQGRIARYLGSARYQNKVAKLEAFFGERQANIAATELSDTPLLKLVNKQIRRRYKKILKPGLLLNAETPDQTIHALRIQAKKLRYLLEFFSELYPEKERTHILKPLRRLQNRLGAFNDYATQQQTLTDYWHDKGRQDSHSQELSLAVGGLLTALHFEQQAQRKAVYGAVDRFCSPAIRKPFKKVF